MTCFTRYILWNLIAVFAVTLAGLTLVLIMAVVAQEAVRQGLGLEPIVRLLPYLMPDALRFALPAAMLFAVCMVYGRMSAANEFVAIKSLGISPLKALWPALALAFLVSLVAVWLNDAAVSWGRQGVYRVVLHSVEEIAYGMLRSQRSYSTRQFSIGVRGVEGRKLIQPIVFLRADGENSPTIMLTADSAELRSNPEDSTLSIWLTNSIVDVDGEITGIFPETYEYVVPLSQASKKGNAPSGPANCALRLLPRRTLEQRADILELEQTMAAEAAYQMLSGDFAELSSDAWRLRHGRLRGAQDTLHRFEMEPWRRWASGFSCLFFALAGAPLAVWRRREDIWTTFAFCFFPILVCYYPLLIIGVDRSKSGEWPSYSVWLGNIVIGLAGLWLMRLLVRE